MEIKELLLKVLKSVEGCHDCLYYHGKDLIEEAKKYGYEHDRTKRTVNNSYAKDLR